MRHGERLAWPLIFPGMRDSGVSTVQLENMTGVCAKFPYRLEHISGTITQETNPPDSVNRAKLDLLGYADGQPVSIQGEVKGERPASVSLRIRARNVPIDDKLCG